MAEDKVLFKADGSHVRSSVEEMHLNEKDGVKHASLDDLTSTTPKTRSASVPVGSERPKLDLAALRSRTLGASSAKKEERPLESATMTDTQAVLSKFAEVSTSTSTEPDNAVVEAETEATTSKSSTKDKKSKPKSRPKPKQSDTMGAVPAEESETITAQAPVPVPESANAPTEVEELNFSEEVQALTPVSAESASAPKSVESGHDAVQSIPVAKPDASGSFTLVPIIELLKLAHADVHTFSNWCAKCVRQSISMPAVIFTSSFGGELRFYNYFTLSSNKHFYAVVGVGDKLSCCKVEFQTKELEDSADKLSVDSMGALSDGEYVVLYTERLRANTWEV